MPVPHRKHKTPLFLAGITFLLYVDNVRTLQEAQNPTVSYGGGL
jgi:hypothetical protein